MQSQSRAAKNASVEQSKDSRGVSDSSINASTSKLSAWAVVDWGEAEQWEKSGLKRYGYGQLDLVHDENAICQIILGEWNAAKRLAMQLAGVLNGEEPSKQTPSGEFLDVRVVG